MKQNRTASPSARDEPAIPLIVFCLPFERITFLAKKTVQEEHNYNLYVAVCFGTVNCLKLMDLNSDCRAGFSRYVLLQVCQQISWNKT